MKTNINPKYFLILIALFIVIVLLTTQYPVITYDGYCNKNFKYGKEKNDSLFRKIGFRGVIAQIDFFRSGGRDGYYKIWLQFLPNNTSRNINAVGLSYWECSWEEKKCWMGVQEPIKIKLSRGDTLLKAEGSKYYEVHTRTGERIISELRFYGGCRGDSCTYLPCN